MTRPYTMLSPMVDWRWQDFYSPEELLLMLGEQTGIFKAYTLLACFQTSPTCIFFVAVRKEMSAKCHH